MIDFQLYSPYKALSPSAFRAKHHDDTTRFVLVTSEVEVESAWKFAIPLDAVRPLIGTNGKTSPRLKITLPIDLRHRFPPAVRLSTDVVIVAVAQDCDSRESERADREKMGAAYGIPPRRAPMALFHRVAPRSRLRHVAHNSQDVTPRPS